MNKFSGKVAVVTGAASGIGRGLAERCAEEGMKVVLADIEEEPLFQAEKELQSAGVETLAVVTNVAKESAIQALAEKTIESFGAVHLLFNNAGVGAGTTIVESTTVDWNWVIGVNLYGAIFGIKTFAPIMMKQAEGGYIVNTASRAGLETAPFNGIYTATKHAVVSLSETLYHELKMAKAPVGISVLCPGFVRTRIFDADRNRPAALRNPIGTGEASPQTKAMEDMVRGAVENGMDPKMLADLTFKAIVEERFYILPDPEMIPAVQTRMENILSGNNPTIYIPKAFKEAR